VEFKKPGDPVTAADRDASAMIVSALSRAFPADGILSEEKADSAERLDRPRVWIIDPMDGTKGFIDKTGDFVVMIGLAIDGTARLGVVYQPIGNVLYAGVVGAGAWIVSASGVVRPDMSQPPAHTGLIMAASRLHSGRTGQRVGDLLGVDGVVSSGSVGLKIALLIRRDCDIYVVANNRTHQWDSCGPDAILHAAGGKLTDLFGDPLRYNRPDSRNRAGFIASNGRIHADSITKLAALRDELKLLPDN
jgi:3'(2'), 5'-bisphosphate nucleotidase